jgi:hypothetical protein
MSDQELSRLLSELQQNAQKLNEASDSINLVVTSIEQKIVESNVGLECWLDFDPIDRTKWTYWRDDSNTDHSSRTETILGFAKLVQPEGWRLAVREREVDTYGEETKSEYKTPTPLWRASRELRIRALEKMPDIIELLRDEAKRSLEAIARAKKLVE